MKIYKVLLFSAITLFTFSRCSTDVDIYSDYKDITIVYGLVDRADDTIWLKVTKAFLGEGNALHFAQNPDSSNYPYKLDISLTGIKNGSEIQKLSFDTMTIQNKQAGDSIFYYPNQLMYYAVPSGKLNPSAVYHLSIKKNDGELTATTPVIPDFPITYPISRINFNLDKEIEWKSAVNGKRYEVGFTFHYKEHIEGTADTLNKTISWALGVKKSVETNGNEIMSIPYTGDQFFSLLDNNLEKESDITRWAGNVDVVIACGSQDFDTYYEVNNASGGMLQEVPNFSNIKGENSLGLLAARHNVSKAMVLSVVSELKLVKEYDLGFVINR